MSERRRLEALSARISEAIARAGQAAKEPGSYGFLPDIVQSLKNMQNGLTTMDVQQRNRLSAGLGRIVTDNYDFSESDLGTLLLKLAGTEKGTGTFMMRQPNQGGVQL